MPAPIHHEASGRRNGERRGRGGASDAGRRWWHRSRRRAPVMTPQQRQMHALALAVGDLAAPRVRELLTAVTINGGSALEQRTRLPRQAFFVLDGRLAITVAGHPVAVLGPGSFFGESDTTRIARSDIPRVHALGTVVVGVAGPLELPRIHQMVPDLPTFTVTAVSDPTVPSSSQEADSIESDDDDPLGLHDDVMGLGLLERIAR